jgi:hypothetical protein
VPANGFWKTHVPQDAMHAGALNGRKDVGQEANGRLSPEQGRRDEPKEGRTARKSLPRSLSSIHPILATVSTRLGWRKASFAIRMNRYEHCGGLNSALKLKRHRTCILHANSVV